MKNDGLGEFDKIWTDVRGFMPVNSRILITGANGLVASNLVDAFMHFNKKYDTHNHIEAVCRNREKAEKRFVDYVGSDEFSICCQDVCDFELDQPCDYIFHTASNAHPLAYSTNPIETIKTNVIGTMKILEYAVKANVKKIVYVSTSEIYGDKNADTANERFVETEYGSINTLVSRSCYSESKRCAETVCICYGQEKDLDIKIVRPGYIYGAQITDENSRADAQFLRNVIGKSNIVMKSEGLQKRSYCYVADAVSAMIYVLMKGSAGQAYNIANSESEASVREYAEALAKCGGVEVVFDIPAEIESKGYSMIKNSLLSDKKLRSLGWKPKYDLNQGVTEMLNKF